MRLYVLSKSQLGHIVGLINENPSTRKDASAMDIDRLGRIQELLRNEERLTLEIPYATASRVLEQINTDMRGIMSMPVMTNDDEALLGELSDLKVVLKRHFQVA